MRKLFLFILLFSFSFGQNEKLVISILDFKGEDVSEKVLRASYQTLETSLIQSNRFTVVDKKERDAVLKEQQFQQSGLCDDSCIVDLGKYIGAEYLVVGEIIEFPGLYQIDLKILSVETGETTKKVTSQIDGGMKELLAGIEEGSREIVRQIASAGSSTPQTISQGIQLAQKTYGKVSIESTPSGATVMIDGNESGFTPIVIDEVESGTRSLMLILPGYETLSKGVIIKQNETSTVSEVLIPKTGSLTILSEPVGGMVYVEGVPKGITPLSLNSLEVRDYIIDVELKDYRKITQRVTVQYNANTTQKFELQPMPGTVNAIIDPISAVIKVRGKKYKSGSSGITKITLGVGKHELEITADGYESQVRKITLGANESLPLEINLKKKPAGVSSNPDIGFLIVHSLNDDVSLKISKIKGSHLLPLDYFELQYGQYNLKASKKGFESKKETVVIKRQQTEKLEINLNKKSANKALKYSLYFPGMGQMYSENYQRGFLYTATTIAMGALIGQGFGTWQSENDLMDQYYSTYKEATTPEQINSSWDVYNTQVGVVNDAQTQLMIFSGVLAGSWIISAIDAYYFSGLR